MFNVGSKYVLFTQSDKMLQKFTRAPQNCASRFLRFHGLDLHSNGTHFEYRLSYRLSSRKILCDSS
jgi:hypothetical protein